MPSNSGAWYANNYLVALKYGLLTAEELDNGDLTKPCTRQEMAMLLVRAAYRSNGEVADKLIPTAKIADYADVADEYKSYVVQSYSMGLLVGIDEKGTFNPDGVLNRAQAATAIYRLIDPSTRAVINDDQISFEWKNGITYEGGYKNGERADGYGTMFFPEIGTYTGSFSHGRREGTGTFNWIVGDSYTGMWNNDKMCGEGKYTFADGTVIDGTWNNNRIVLETFYMEPSSLNISINSSASIAAICPGAVLAKAESRLNLSNTCCCLYFVRYVLLRLIGKHDRIRTAPLCANCWTWLSYFGSGHGKESAI